MRTRRTSRARREAGFTMIEVMVALLLTAIAMLGIMSLYMAETRASGYSRHTTEASILAQDGLEKLRSQAVPVAATITGVDEQARAVTGGLFTRTSTVTAVGTYYDLAVTVTWDEDGRTRTVTLNTRRSQ